MAENMVAIASLYKSANALSVRIDQEENEKYNLERRVSVAHTTIKTLREERAAIEAAIVSLGGTVLRVPDELRGVLDSSGNGSWPERPVHPTPPGPPVPPTPPPGDPVG